MVGLLLFIHSVKPATPPIETLHFVQFGVVCWVSLSAFFSLIFFVVSSSKPADTDMENWQKGSTQRWALYSNPVTINFAAVYFLGRGIVWLALRVPTALAACGRGFVVIVRTIASFLWHLVRIIHSDCRLLSGTSALTGVLVGFFAGSVMMGGLVGLLCGPIAYELVYKRLLRVVPVRANNNHTG